MQSRFMITSSPHARDRMTTQRIMQIVCLALAPAGIVGVVMFGIAQLAVIGVTVLTCVVTELLWQKLTNQKVTVGDWSAVVTGLLLAYNIPAGAPIWLNIVGGIFAILVVKQMFGGIGSNFMNPALTARAVLFVSWSSLMTTYPATRYAVDAVSTATPLATLASDPGSVSFMDLLIGNHGGMLGETCALALIVGGLYLIIRRIIDWKIPVCMIGMVFLCYLIMGGAELAAKEVLAGGLLLGAFFMATDYATTPVSDLGRIIFGAGCGILVFVIRAFANFPEGTSFAILFMNVCTPLIDRFTMPTPFGEVKKHG